MNTQNHRRSNIVCLKHYGLPVSCEEKLKVLNENLEEIRQYCPEAFTDALLMGCDEEKVRKVFEAVVRSIENPYKKV